MGKDSENILLSPFGNAVAGGLASIFTTSVTYPLDLIRTRFQVNDGIRINIPKYGNTFKAIHKIYIDEGIRGLYGGITPAVVGATASWSLYLFGYSWIKNEFQKHGYEGIAPIVLGAICSGVATSVITNPIWVIKTRMQMQRLTLAPELHYSGIFNAAKTIYKKEGFLAYYNGLAPAMAASYHGAVQFAIYESVCSWFNSHRSTDDVWVYEAFIAGGLSKVAALLSTQPLSVIKARLQEQRSDLSVSPKYTGAFDAFQKILKNEGFFGFYKGVGPALGRLAFHSAIFFTVLEQVRTTLRKFSTFVNSDVPTSN